VGAVLMIILTIVVLAAAVAESRDRVRRDILLDITALRAWYEERHGRRGRSLTERDLEEALRRALALRRWGPIALSAGTLAVAVALTGLAASEVPGIETALRQPGRVVDLVPVEALVQVAAVFTLLPILVVEGILAALYLADLDIGRLRRLLESLRY